jgi:cell division protein FtsQ
VSRLWLLVLVPLLLLAASYFAWPIREVVVSGHRQLSQAEVQALVGASVGRPWLWLGVASPIAISGQPWLASVEVVKHLPARVEIRVSERRPWAQFVRSDLGEHVVVAQDGTVLWRVQPQRAAATPNTKKPKPPPLPKLVIRGSGGNRLQEALVVARDWQASEVTYTAHAMRLVSNCGRNRSPPRIGVVRTIQHQQATRWRPSTLGG